MSVLPIDFIPSIQIQTSRALQRIQVILFESKEDFDTFVNEGWEATSEASAVAGEDSEQLSKQFNSGVAVYQLNAKGLLIDANVSGSKYWVNEELTNSQ